MRSPLLLLLIVVNILPVLAQDAVPEAPACPVPPFPTTNLQILRKIDHARFYAYPNGWGSTPAAARKDLDRVMGIYLDRPGYFRHSYVRIVPVSKTQYEADGCVSYFAPDAKLPRQVKGLPAN